MLRGEPTSKINTVWWTGARLMLWLNFCVSFFWFCVFCIEIFKSVLCWGLVNSGFHLLEFFSCLGNFGLMSNFSLSFFGFCFLFFFLFISWFWVSLSFFLLLSGFVFLEEVVNRIVSLSFKISFEFFYKLWPVIVAVFLSWLYIFFQLLHLSM